MRRAATLIAVLAIALTAGCSSAPAQMTVHGTVRVIDNRPIGPLPVSFGDQVTVTDPSGKVIGVGHLGDSDDQGRIGTLTFGWTARVPEGQKYYGIHVDGLQGTTQFTQAQMQHGPAACAGAACS